MNLPNKITLIRIFLVPVFVALYLLDFKLISVGVFVFAASTDFVDGKIARKYNLVTDLGKLLDTTADKLLVTGGLLLIITDTAVLPAAYGVVAGLLIVGRDFIVMGLRSIAAKKGTVIAADMWGKYKQAVIDVALVMFMVFASNVFKGSFQSGFEIACYVMLGLGSLLSVISCVNYIVKNRNALK